MIELRSISKAFGGQAVLNNIDLTVRKGDVVALLGPSGAGKTTLLRCVNFLDKADTGSVTIGDLTVPCAKPSPREVLRIRRKTAMVFQSYNLFRHKTVLENVMEGLVIVQGLDRRTARDKSIALIEKVGMVDKLDFYPSQLSGGQQQRTGIARALALEPEIILFDEPTSALDPELVGEVLDVIKQLAAEGVTMMIVTHEMAFAREVSTQSVLMSQGTIVEDARSADFFGRPQELRTRQFLHRFSSPVAALA
jgi:L-cystine transport system ATP-binding protein